MNDWKSTSYTEREFRKVEGTWLCVSEIEALQVGNSGIDVYLKSGSRITLRTERTQKNLDMITRQLLLKDHDD